MSPNLTPDYLVNVDEELEAKVLGSIIYEPRQVGVLLKYIKKASIFYKATHRQVYEAYAALAKEGKPIDLFTVSQWMRSEGRSVTAGDLAGLCDGAYMTNIDQHCLMLYQLAIRRYLMNYGAQLQRAASDPLSDPLSVLHKVDQDIDAVLGSINSINEVKTDDHLNAVFQDMIDKQMGRKRGINLGIEALDQRTGGFAPSDFVILAAGTGQGKTGVAIHIIKNLCLEQRLPVGVVTLEMKGSQYMSRLVASETNASNSEINRAHGLDVEQMRAGSKRLYGMPLQIHDRPIELVELLFLIREWVRRYDTKVIVLDYLQLVNDSRSKSTLDRVSKISSSLKQIAAELDILVIALSQLSRAYESRTGIEKRPMLSDLRESGQLEQDANAVVMLFRPFKYGIQYEDGSCDKHTMEVHGLKFRGAEPTQRNEPWLFDYDGACNRLCRFGLLAHATEVQGFAPLPKTDLGSWTHEPKAEAGF